MAANTNQCRPQPGLIVAEFELAAVQSGDRGD